MNRLIGLCLLLSSCVFHPAPSDLDRTDSAEIRVVLDHQVLGWNSGRIDDYMEGYWHSDSVRFASDNDIVFGWQTVCDRYKKNYPDASRMGKLSFRDVTITSMAPAGAVVFGRWELAREKDAPCGLFTLIMRKRPEGWRIISDHTSSKK